MRFLRCPRPFRNLGSPVSSGSWCNAQSRTILVRHGPRHARRGYAFPEESRETTTSSIDCGIVAAKWDCGASPETCAKRKHYARYQQSGHGSAAERSSLEEKAVNCGELSTHGHGSGKVLAGLRSIHRGVDYDQRQEIRPDPRVC